MRHRVPCHALAFAILLFVSNAISRQVPAEEGQWVALWQDAYSGMPNPGLDPERVAAVPAVDRTTGEVYLSFWTYGIWKSTDEGKSFVRVDGKSISGDGCGPIRGASFYIHPEGKKIAAFNMNNNPGPSGFSTDGGQSWTRFEAVGRNWDFGAIDWESQLVFAARHEFEALHISADAGKTWTQLDRERWPVSGLGVAGKSLLLATAEGIERSEDNGKSWKKISALVGTGPTLAFNGKLWWLSEAGKGVLVSTDQGATWEIQGVAAPGAVELGPFFGKDENHLVLVGNDGFYETLDGCKTWKLAVAMPPDFKLSGAAFDPVHDIFYLTGHQLPVMKFLRGRKPEYVTPSAGGANGAESSAPRPKAEFVETPNFKTRCTVGAADAVLDNYLFVTGEDGFMIFRRDLQSGKLTFIEQQLELKAGGFALVAAGGRLYGVTPHDGYRRMSWHGLGWFEVDPATGHALKKGVVECPASRQMLVGPGQKDLYLKSCGGEQNRVFWYRIGDDGTPVKSAEVEGKGIGASNFSDYPGLLIQSKDGRDLYTISSKDYSIAQIRRDPTGAIKYAGATDLAVVAKAAPENYGYQWVSLAISPDGVWLYASVRNGKPTHNFYGIFKRDPETGALTFRETVNGEQDPLANMKGWNMLFSPSGTGGYLGNFAGPLTTFNYDSKTGHLSNVQVVNETKWNGTSILAADTEHGLLYVTGREYTWDRIFSLKIDKAK